MSDIDRESMMEVFTFEMGQMLEQLEQIVIEAENGYTTDHINEIFRIMHTIKGSAAMMLFNNISKAAHSIEDLFFYLREKNPTITDISKLTDNVLESMDFLKDELAKLQEGGESDGDPSGVQAKISGFLAELKFQNGDGPPPGGEEASETAPDKTKHLTRAAAEIQRTEMPEDENLKVYDAIVAFVEGSEMENVRAYTLVYNLKNIVHDLKYVPEDLIDESSIETIRDDGFRLQIVTDKDYETIYGILANTIYAKDIILEERKRDEKAPPVQETPVQEAPVQEVPVSVKLWELKRS